ncbi:unnamed protein product [Phytomonas sp. EM1]|nr:unnamed protein product [Phytomonas sp. EM1]|eukprot:CCW63082.1 unnamed protein product [Phytomonas sp. isolate EM1]
MQGKGDVDFTQTLGRVGMTSPSGAGIAYPDIDLIKKERLGGSSVRAAASECSPDRARSRSLTDNGDSAQPSAGVITLLKHLQARLQHTENLKTTCDHDKMGVARGKDPTSSTTDAVPSGGAMNTKSLSALCASPVSSERSCVQSVVVEGAYILGCPFAQHVDTASSHSSSSTTPLMGARRASNLYVSSITTLGDYVAAGDCSGNVVVMKRRPMSTIQREGLSDLARDMEEEESDEFSSPRLSCTGNVVIPPRTKDPYEFCAKKKAYDSMICPLNSVEVLPDVTALAFLPQISPTVFLLASNEKIPKLFKVLQVHESAPRFRAVDRLDSDLPIPLMSPSPNPTVLMKQVSRYAPVHEYNIHSLHPLPDSEQFITADELTIHLWCTEHPDTSIETFSMRPPCEDDPCEMIRRVRHFPHEPFLLFVVTSFGVVRVLDIRQSLRWSNQASQLFENPPHRVEESFKCITNSLSDCGLSACGRYIAGRDLMTVCLWDVRAASGVETAASISRGFSPAVKMGEKNTGRGNFKIVRSWELYPDLHRNLRVIYQSSLFLQKNDIQFLNPTQVCTGGLGRSIFTVDINQSTPDLGEKSLGPSVSSSGIKALRLPVEDELTDLPKGIVPKRAFMDLSPLYREFEGDQTTTDRNSTTNACLDLEAQVTHLSRPMISPGGVYGMLACCRELVVQLSYSS